MGVDRSEGLAGRLAEAKAVAERAGRALTKKESEGMVRVIGLVVTIYGRFLCATNRRNFISDGMTMFLVRSAAGALPDRTSQFSVHGLSIPEEKAPPQSVPTSGSRNAAFRRDSGSRDTCISIAARLGHLPHRAKQSRGGAADNCSPDGPRAVAARPRW